MKSQVDNDEFTNPHTNETERAITILKILHTSKSDTIKDRNKKVFFTLRSMAFLMLARETPNYGTLSNYVT